LGELGVGGADAARDDRRALRLSDVDVLVDALGLAAVDERAELRLPAVRQADPDASRLVGEALDELVVDGPLDEDARAGGADLALGEVDPEDGTYHGAVEV